MLENFKVKVQCDTATADYLYGVVENEAYCSLFEHDYYEDEDKQYTVTVGIHSIDDADFYFFNSTDSLNEAYEWYEEWTKYISRHKTNMNGYHMRNKAQTMGFIDGSN